MPCVGIGHISGAQVLDLFFPKSSPYRKESCIFKQRSSQLQNWMISKPGEISIWKVKISAYSGEWTQTDKALRRFVCFLCRRRSVSLSFCHPQGERPRSLGKLRSCDFHQLNLRCCSDAFKRECQLWCIFKNQWSGKFKEASDHTVLWSIKANLIVHWVIILIFITLRIITSWGMRGYREHVQSSSNQHSFSRGRCC